MCNYCSNKNNWDTISPDKTNGFVGPFIMIIDDRLNFMAGIIPDIKYADFKVNYCPMCGMKLNED